MARKSKGDFALILLALIGGFVVWIVSAIASAVSELALFVAANKWPIFIVVTILALVPLLYPMYQQLYFRGKKFAAIKNSISSFIDNCNELNIHIAELKGAYIDIKAFDYGSSSILDESKFQYKRTHWSNETKTQFVHHCSSTVCKNAQDQPMKYLCKYFDIKISENSLENFEGVLNDFAAAEQGKYLLKKERDSILKNIESSIPWLIRQFNQSKLIRELGFEEIDLSDLYFPVYTFQYTSAGGKSSFNTPIKLDIGNLESLINYMKGLIDFRKSIAGQRALMTSGLREKIKSRDKFTCLKCGVSTSEEPNLLLEIDLKYPLIYVT